MDKLRLYVWVALAGLFYYLYITWQIDYPSPKAITAEQTVAPSNDVPALPSDNTSVKSPAAVDETSKATTTTAPAAPITPAEKVRVRTDVLDLDISTLGGELSRADLIRYPQSKDKPNVPVRLFDSTSSYYFLARSGLRAAGDRAAPTHQVPYTAATKDYQLREEEKELKVALTWSDGQGIDVIKTYTFHRGSYAIAIDYQVTNKSNSEWSAASYVQLARRQPHIETSMFEADSYAHLGPAVYDGKSYHKLSLTDSDDQRYKNTISGGWLAAMQHHFVAAAVPVADKPYDYQLNVDGPDAFTFAYRGPVTVIPANADGTFHETIYVGPKLQDQLAAIGSRLDLTADYGMFTIISEPLFWVLAKVHNFIGNWGWSIIIVTLLIKLVFYKLTEASGRSMAKMREMAPRLKAMQERYKDDREALGRATMEFYKREKINPVAGCLPMLIQMPVWMAFYWVLANSVEMRQAPFMGWITDLTARDPYFILPIILVIVNYIQFKLNPAPTDPIQAKVMGLMPIMMGVMMAWFPAGLALYWVTNTGLSILQQWHINRVMAADTAKKT